MLLLLLDIIIYFNYVYLTGYREKCTHQYHTSSFHNEWDAGTEIIYYLLYFTIHSVIINNVLLSVKMIIL